MFILALLCVLISSCPLLFLLILRRDAADGGSRLPPSPSRLPIIGNLHQLGYLPHRSLRALSEKHGPVILLRLGYVPAIVVSSVDAAREVMKTHDLVFASRPSIKVARITFHGCLDLAFAPYGEHWRMVRKFCVTHLFSAKMVQSFRRIREEEVASMIGNISSSSSSIVDMSKVLYIVTTNILMRVICGKLEDGCRDRLYEIVVESNDLLAGFHAVEVLPWHLEWLDVFFGSRKRAIRNSMRWGDILDHIIKDHHTDVPKSNSEMDFVDMLLSLQNDPLVDFKLTKDHMKALLTNMFAAGTDTSYLTLEWAMTELIRNPKKLSKLQDEVRVIAKDKAMVREEDVHGMSYLKAVLKEALRLHPPVPLLLPRESREDCEVQGYRVPKKTRVIINAWAIGRDRESWEAAEEFQPERFINSDVDFKGNDFQFIPFGAGRRICPGMNFAVSTTELVLANLVHRFNWELPSGMTSEGMDMTETPGLTAGRKQKLHLVAKLFTC